MRNEPGNRLYWILNGFLSILLILIKAPTLNLPHYWDEAFPYSFAIGYMTENGPGLLPDAAPSQYTTGHPLLYYFSQACWNRLVGETLWMQRIFPLLISIGCLWMTSLVGTKLFNKTVGMGAAVLLLVQSAFLGNATFQLPETMLTLLLLSTLYFLHTDRKWLFTLSSTLLLFVKEPAVVLLALIFFFHCFILLRGKSVPERMKALWMYAIPVALNLSFYLLQYVMHGWLLYPRHVGYMHFSIDFVLNQLNRYFLHLFIYSGRNGMFFTTLVLAAFVGWHKKLRWGTVAKGVLLLTVVTVGYLLFSAFNYYSNRYILCLFPLFALLTSASLYYSIGRKIKIYAVAVAFLAGVALYASVTDTRDTDHSLGYANTVRCQQAGVRYCVEQQWQNKFIYTDFLMFTNMTSHYPRHLTKSEIFYHVDQHTIENAEVIVLTNHEKHLLNHPVLRERKLVKEFAEGKSWCRIYVR